MASAVSRAAWDSGLEPADPAGGAEPAAAPCQNVPAWLCLHPLGSAAATWTWEQPLCEEKLQHKPVFMCLFLWAMDICLV